MSTGSFQSPPASPPVAPRGCGIFGERVAAGPAATGRVLLLAVAANLLTVVVYITNGHYQPELAIVFVPLLLAFIAVTAAVCGFRNAEFEKNAGRWLVAVFWIGLAIHATGLIGSLPGHYVQAKSFVLNPRLPWHRSLQPYFFCAALLVVGGAGVLAAQTAQWRRVLVTGLAALFAIVGWWMIRASPAPLIDTFTSNQMAAQTLLNGQSPYAMRAPNIYGDDSSFLAPGASVGGVMQYGYSYPPLALLLVLPGYILGGDHRFAFLGAMCGAALLMYFARPGRTAAAAAVLFLLMPRSLLVLENAWNEPLIVLLLAAVVFLAARAPALVPVAFGLLMVVKQYMLLVAPALLLLYPWQQWRRLGPASVLALVCGLAVTVPFVLQDPANFWLSAVRMHFRQPFRTDSLAILAFGDLRAPVWGHCAMGLSAVAVALAIWRCPRNASGFAIAIAFALFTFFFLKQAFLNYYYLVIGALWIAVATSEPEPADTTTGTSPPSASSAAGSGAATLSSA